MRTRGAFYSGKNGGTARFSATKKAARAPFPAPGGPPLPFSVFAGYKAAPPPLPPPPPPQEVRSECFSGVKGRRLAVFPHK